MLVWRRLSIFMGAGMKVPSSFSLILVSLALLFTAMEASAANPATGTWIDTQDAFGPQIVLALKLTATKSPNKLGVEGNFGLAGNEYPVRGRIVNGKLRGRIKTGEVQEALLDGYYDPVAKMMRVTITNASALGSPFDLVNGVEFQCEKSRKLKLAGNWTVFSTNMSGGIKSPFVIQKVGTDVYKGVFNGDTYHSGLHAVLTGTFDGRKWTGQLKITEATVRADGDFEFFYSTDGNTRYLLGSIEWTNDYDYVARTAQIELRR